MHTERGQPKGEITRRYGVALTLISALLFVGGCSSTGDKTASKETDPVAREYADAKSAIELGDYDLAITRLEQFENRYPFSPYGQQAMLDLAYAHYKNDDATSAIAATERFIKLYPRHEHVDYAYYLRGLASYRQVLGRSMLMVPLDPAERDPRQASNAFQYFSELVQLFPESRYAPDAAQRMVELRNILARHELFVAKYYMQREAYVAAINRAKYIIEHYQQTPSVTDALMIMADGYDNLGLGELAADARRTLELNQAQSSETQ